MKKIEAKIVLKNMETRLREDGELWDDEEKAIDVALAAIDYQTEQFTKQSKNLTLRADLQDACERLRWIANVAELAGGMDDEDRAAVTLACDALEGRIDKAPGVDSDRNRHTCCSTTIKE